MVHKQSTKSFAAFGLRLVLILCDVKKSKKQQLAPCTMSIRVKKKLTGGISGSNV
jgi:hypothetical protein